MPKRSREAQEACIKRDGMCMVCGVIDDTLVGHHISSFGASGDDSLENMITLCGRCHGNAHNGYIDYSVINLPIRKKYIPDHPQGGVMASGRGTRAILKVWDVDNILKQIVEGEYDTTS